MLDWVNNKPVIYKKNCKQCVLAIISWYRNLSIETLNNKINITSFNIIILLKSVTEINVLKCFTELIAKFCCVCNLYWSSCFLTGGSFLHQFAQQLLLALCSFLIDLSILNEIIRNLFEMYLLLGHFMIYTQIMIVFVSYDF